MSIIIAMPPPLRQPMKFDFEIKTEPTLRALVAIAIVAFGSGSLTSIAVALGDPLTGQFCALVLVVMCSSPSAPSMDPVADLDLPPAANGGNMALGAARSHRSASTSSHQSIAGLGDSITNNPPSQQSRAANYVMLRISPATGSATFGYIYLSDTEQRHEAAITAYFDSAGREVDVLPCPDFEQFVADNNLLYRDLLFVSDIPRYIIPAGLRILKAQNYDDSPCYDWLPDPPSLSSFGPSSRSPDTSQVPSSQRSRSLHATPPPLDLARIRTDLPPTYLITPSILTLPSDTSEWGATMRFQTVVMGGCPR